MDFGEEFRLGYCPTMEAYAERIQSEHPLVEAIPLGSSTEALTLLRENKITATLIGRVAKQNEIEDDTGNIWLSEGHTLITRSKRFVEYQALSNSTIHTALPEETVRPLLPAHTRVIYHNTAEEAVLAGIDEAVLINWRDHDDRFNLLVPLSDGRKIEAFRVPIVYFNPGNEPALERFFAKYRRT